ncbi:MAG: VWA domain-containing protein [Ignavibacteriae bacterium]|nr:VWA domain-containing protein [Ignavibacteriota bacterium]
MRRRSIHARGRLRIAAALTVVLLSCAAAVSVAQFQMQLRPPDVQRWPEVRIPLRVTDNSATIRTIAPENFVVFENGVRQGPLRVECENDSLTNVVHFMFVLDVSLSMAFIEGTRDYDPDSVKWRRAKQVFVESFRRLRPIDYGAFLSFARTSALHQNFTHDADRLARVIESLSLRSGTAIYDAALMALGYCDADTGKTVMILLTDGSDQSSISSIDDVVNMARTIGVPIYMIGLGVDSIDVPGMRSMAERTGGEFFLAPTSEQLSDVLGRIMRSVVLSECVLSYTSADTCRAGGMRQVDVTVTLNGNTQTGTVDYTVPDFRSRLAVRPVLPDTVEDNRLLRVPLRADGELRAGEQIDIELEYLYDPALLRYERVETVGDVCDGVPLNVDAGTPGMLRITAAGTPVARGVRRPVADTLFHVVFTVLERRSNMEGRLEARVRHLRQQCEVLADGSASTFVVNGCPALLRLHLPVTAYPTRENIVGLRVELDDTIDTQQPLGYSFHVSYDAGLMTFDAAYTTGTMSALAQVVTREDAPGELDVSVAPSPVPYGSGTLVMLLFRPRYQNTPSRVSCVIRNLRVSQSCEPRIEFTGSDVMLDGYCQPLLVKQESLKLHAISPNPLQAGGHGVATILYSVRGTDRARLEITTMEGEVVRVLVDAYLPKGEHNAALPVGDLPSGSYLCTLREGYSLATKLLLVTR